jgi:hypothetical protein
MYKPGADLSVPVLGVDRAVEVKCRADGFRELYGWLEDRDVLIVKPSGDRQACDALTHPHPEIW